MSRLRTCAVSLARRAIGLPLPVHLRENPKVSMYPRNRKRRTLRWSLPIAAAGLTLLTGCAALNAIGEGPTAALSVAPPVGPAPLLVRLDAGASTGTAGIVFHQWNFGDGSAETTEASTIQHRYDRSGTYVASVTVVDTDGWTSSASVEITIENTPPFPSCRFSNDAPVVGEAVQFDASGSTDPDGDVIDVRWDFGDGVTARGSRVTHVYSEPTVCFVRLEIEDNGGAVATLVHTMTVHLGSGSGCGGGAPIWL